MDSDDTVPPCQKKIVVCAQDSDQFERCVKWLESFFSGHEGRTYEFHLVSVIPQGDQDICGVMAEGLGVPASLARCGNSLDRGVVSGRERDAIAKRASLLMGQHHGTIHIVRRGHGDAVDAVSVGQVVCNMCDDIDASMVVVSRYGRSKSEDLRHIFQGSVVTYVLEHCSAPILVYVDGSP